MNEPSSDPHRFVWWRHPLLACGIVAAALVAIGDAYPLSPFPMYSNIDTSADILLVTNEKDEVLPLSRLFNSGSAQLKKRFEKELQKTAGTREYEQAPEAKRRQAGETFLKELWAGRDKGDVAKLPSAPQSLRLKIRTVTMDGTVFTDATSVVSEITVTGEGGLP